VDATPETHSPEVSSHEKKIENHTLAACFSERPKRILYRIKGVYGPESAVAPGGWFFPPMRWPVRPGKGARWRCGGGGKTGGADGTSGLSAGPGLKWLRPGAPGHGAATGKGRTGRWRERRTG